MPLAADGVSTPAPADGGGITTYAYNDLSPTGAPTPVPATYTVQSGDSLSSILGTSDPAAVGAFMQVNGLTSSTIHPGDQLVLPSRGYNSSDAALGQATLNSDNARLAALHPSTTNSAGFYGSLDMPAYSGSYDSLASMVAGDRGGFFSGIGHALYEAVYQPAATVYDAGQVVREAGRSLITGEAPRDIDYASGLGMAAARGASTGDILIGGLNGAVMTPVRLGQAIGQGDAYAAGEELTNLGLLLAGGVGGADSAVTMRANSLLARDLAKQDFVYRAVPESYLDFYRAENRIITPNSEPTYFSLEAGADPVAHAAGTQLSSTPDVLLKIPVSALEGATVPRPNWGGAWLGREYTVDSYPNLGVGGYRQFVGTTSTFSEDWIVRGWGSK